MKVIAICGSPNSQGNTAIALEILREKLISHMGDKYTENFEYEIIYLRKLDLRSCNGCYGCRGKGKCVHTYPHQTWLTQTSASKNSLIKSIKYPK